MGTPSSCRVARCSHRVAADRSGGGPAGVRHGRNPVRPAVVRSRGPAPRLLARGGRSRTSSRLAEPSDPQLRLPGRQRRFDRTRGRYPLPEHFNLRSGGGPRAPARSSQPSLRAIVGGSYGGMVALAFAERFPERVGTLCIISAADRPHPMAIAWHSIQRRIVKFAIQCARPQEGLQLARAVGLSLYRSSEEFAARFPATPRLEAGEFVFPVERYLFVDGAEPAATFRAEAFLCLSESLDLHQVDATRIFVPTTAVAAREDQLVPLADVRALVARMGAAQVREISSIHGHDAYLREPEQIRAILAGAL
ncbi:MAG: alpha/beta fold hydrolase [Acetobacteraceae bacterium]